MVTVTETADLDRLLAHYGLGRTDDPLPVATGTLNRNYRVPVTDGTPEDTVAFARCYRADLTREAIGREHAITRWVADRGIPAIAPHPTSEGDTVVELDGRVWSLFPWIDGRTPSRGEIGTAEAESIGDAHGRIQQALATHPESGSATLAEVSDRLAWDTAAARETLDRIEEAAVSATASPAILDALAFRRNLLEGDQPRPFAEFGWLPCQLLHGDFHDQQILLGPDDAVVAVVDWELTKVAARIWELLRALSYSELLETDGLDHYLRGFRRHVRLTEEECRAGIELWWQTRLHSAWVYEAYFLEGNERVGPLLAGTDAHFRRFADPAWRTSIADRLVAAAAAG